MRSPLARGTGQILLEHECAFISTALHDLEDNLWHTGSRLKKSLLDSVWPGTGEDTLGSLGKENGSCLLVDCRVGRCYQLLLG